MKRWPRKKKHSSLLELFLNYSSKFFITLAPALILSADTGPYSQRIIFFVTYELAQYKLECYKQ